MQPRRSYLVCATPRSGSSLLCEALKNTGIAGYPIEYFEALKDTGLPSRPGDYFITLENQELTELLGDVPLDGHDSAPSALQPARPYADYLAEVLEKGTTPNGVFGAKVMWGYFADFISNLRTIPAYNEMPIPDLLSTIFPNLHYIRVSRQDKVRQAISLWKAIQTWKWREDESRSPASQHESQKRELHFHFEAIDHLVQQIVAHEHAWQQYFDEAAIRPYSVIYEDLTTNTEAYETTALQILQYLGVPSPEHLVFAERRMKRQSDKLSEEWIERYHQLKQKETSGC